MRRILLISLLLGTLTLCRAEAFNPPPRHHQVRLGWGDPLFETLAFHEGASVSDPSARTYGFGYTGHFFAEYQYRFNRVVSTGIQTDIEGIFWKQTPGVPSRNYNLSILPTLRLTFLNTRYVQLYGGLAVGLLIAFDNTGRAEAAPVVNLTPLGVQVGKGPWSGSLELGGMTALRNADTIYMLGSRLISLSVNYSW